MLFKSLRGLSVVSSLLVGSVSVAQIDIPSFLEKFDKPDQVIQLKEAGGNLSGVVYNYDTDTYFVIQNNSYQFVEYDKTFSKALRIIKLVNLPDKDTEDLAYLGNGQFAINMETNQIIIFTLKPGQTSVDVNPKLPDVQLLTLPSPRKDNKGVEGLCYTARGGDAGILWAVQEDSPKRVFMIPRPKTMEDVTSSRKMSFSEPFDADKIFKHVMSDLSGCTFHDPTDHLLILSHESSRIMELTRKGVVVRKMDLPSNIATQYEGIAIGPDGELVLASEPNIIVIYKPKK